MKVLNGGENICMNAEATTVNILHVYFWGFSMLLNIIDIIVHMYIFYTEFLSIYCFFREHKVLFTNGTVLFHNVLIYLFSYFLSLIFFNQKYFVPFVAILVECIDDLCWLIVIQDEISDTDFSYPQKQIFIKVRKYSGINPW